MHSDSSEAQNPAAAPWQQTVWSILPGGRKGGTKAGKPVFTVLVTPAMDDATIEANPNLTGTCWIDWFTSVAAAFAANPHFLQVKADDGKPGLPLTISLPRPEDPDAAATAQPKDLLRNRRDLWQAILRTVPPHIQDQSSGAENTHATLPPKPRAGAWTKGFHTANGKRPPSSIAMFAKKWTAQADTRTSDTNFYNGVTLERKPDLKSKDGLQHFWLKNDTGKNAGAPSSDDGCLLLAKGEERNNDLETGIDDWISSASSDDPLVAIFHRDLARMATYDDGHITGKTPPPWTEQAFQTLKPLVLWYLWQKRAPASVTAPYIHLFADETHQTALKGKEPYIDALLFHRRIQPSGGEPQGPPPTDPPKHEYAKTDGPVLAYSDFLEAMATVMHYPSLLQCLGLAFEATAEQVTWAANAFLQVQFADAKIALALGAYLTETSPGVFPLTAVQDFVYPHKAPPTDDYQFPVSDGYLLLANYEAITHDFDSDTIKRHLYAESPPLPEKGRAVALTRKIDGTAQASSGASSYDTMTQGTLPLSSSGISIINRRDTTTHATMLTTRVAHQVKLRQFPKAVPLLYDQDFVHGYSMQVVNPNGTAVSLSARRENFVFPTANGPKALLEEPHRREHIPSSPEASFATDVPRDTPGADPVYDPHIGTRIASWTGWSLGVPTPFAGIRQPYADPPQPNGATKPADVTSGNDATGYPIKPAYTTYPKPYRLPRLRFGGPDDPNEPTKYRLRVRAVDILGNAIASSLDVVQDPGETPKPKDYSAYEVSCYYPRHDPVLAPEVLADASFDPKAKNFGELIDTLAVRHGSSDQGPVRYFVPQADFLFRLIEQGALDTKGQSEGHLKNPATDAVGTFNDIQLDPCGRVMTKTLGSQNMPVYAEPTLPLPVPGTYLPDTYAQWLNIQLHDLATDLYFGPIRMRSFYHLRDEEADSLVDTTEWPHAQHLRMQLLPASPGTKTVHAEWTSQDATRVRGGQTYRGKVSQLNVYLPAGWQIEMRVSCAPTYKQASRIAFDENDNPHPTGAALIANGLSSTHTPSRPITLVHAVKQPLTESYFNANNLPTVGKLVEDSPAATIGGTLVVGDHRSTGLCVVRMEWDEYVDDPAKPCPQVIRHSESLVQIKNGTIESYMGALDPDGSIPQFLPSTLEVADANRKSPVYQFADGSYRSLEFVVDAVSRFQSFYVPPPASDKPAPPSDSPYIRPGKGQARLQPAVTVPKCNTEVPAAVDLAHILPLLPVSADRLPGASGYRRHGGAFRIHLRRGWYSTGNGEQLAIVLVQDNFVQCKNTGWEADKNVSQLFTRWGMDPMWNLAGVPDDFGASPLAANFLPPPELQGFTTPTGATENVDPTVLDPAPGDVRNAELLRYTPVFSSQDGWYVDVIVNRVPAYNTFVRLALARYQPNSLASRRVSKVILAPFLQLLPDRGFRIMPGSVKHSYVLGIYGTPVLLNTPAGGEATMFEVVVEVEAAGQWFKDDDADQAASAPPRRLPQHWSDADRAQSLLTVYEIKIKLHHHRKRRIRVNEYEMRTGYKPISFDPSPSTRFYVSFGEPIELPK